MADTEVIGDTTEQMSTEDIPAEDANAMDATETPNEDSEVSKSSKLIKEELLREETEELKPNSIVKETVDENGDVFEETTEVTRKVVKRTMKITETSSTTKTTTMTTPAKLYGKDLSEYDEVDVDALLAQLSPEEINILAKEVDPDDNFLPPNQRCSYECTKSPTGPLDRKKLIEHINKEALETPDQPEFEPFVKGTVRGKKWVPPARDEREIAAEEQIAIDLGEEYEHALNDASQEEIIDLAAILGFHSMMNQDQYHASLLNKGQPVGLGWDGITKCSSQKLYPMDPPNNTDVDDSIKRVKDDDPKLIELNLNNIKNISDEKFEQLFDALPQNEHLEVLSLTNVGLTDKTALLLAEAIEKSKTLRVLNVETNFISPPVIVTLVKALLKAHTIEEFRASNQRSTVLGNKIEMEITDLVEKNTSLLRLGLHLEYNDARHRVAGHLQRNIDRNEHELKKGTSLSSIPASVIGTLDDLSPSKPLQKTIKAKSPKPLHTELTQKNDRIESKSDLIASLVSQKQSDRGKEDLSLPLQGEKRSHVEAIWQESSQAKQQKLNAIEESKPTEVKPIKQPSPNRHPKLAELRHTSHSKAIDEDVDMAQETNGIPDLPEPQPQPSVEVLNETIETLVFEKSKTPIEKTKSFTEPQKPISEIAPKIDSIPAEPESNIPRQSEFAPSTLSIDQNLSVRESVSPGRNLENNLALIRAKIDSFAEIADEKLSNLRSRFDDISRDASFDQVNCPPTPKLLFPTKAVVEPLPSPLPPKIPSRRSSFCARLFPQTLNSIGITLLFDKRLVPEGEIQVKPILVPPPTAPVSYQVPEQPSSKLGDQTLDRSLTEPDRFTLNPESDQAVVKEPFKPQPITSESNISPPEKPIQTAKPDSVPKQLADHIMETKENPETHLEANISHSEDLPLKTQVMTGNPGSNQSDTKPVEPSFNTNTPDQTLSRQEISPEGNKTGQSQTSSKPDSVFATSEALQGVTNMIDRETTLLSLLSIKKRDSLQIDPVAKIDNWTQSLLQPPPLSRLSMKKCDSQNIDPVKTVDNSTQSAPKPNPLSRLSIKRGDRLDIQPRLTTEIAIQSVLENPQSDNSSQTIEEEPIESLEDSTQTPLVFSSLEHDYIFPGLRRIPHLSRSKTINIGGGDRVIIKPSSKPINEILMLLYPVYQDYSAVKPKKEPDDSAQAPSKSFELDELIIKEPVTDNTIEDLEEVIKQATEDSEYILQTSVSLPEEKEEETEEENQTAVKSEVEIPLVDEPSPLDESTAIIAKETHYETKYTAVEKVRVKLIEEEHVSQTSIRSANMWQSLSSNLLKASEQTLLDLSKATQLGETVSSTRTKVGKISIYSSVEDLARSKYADRHLGGLIKTVEKTSVYSSTEDLPLVSYTKYSDRYKTDHGKAVEKVSAYSSTEELPITSYPRHYDSAKTVGKRSVYSSTEDLPQTYTRYSDRYDDDYSGSRYSTTLPRAKYDRQREEVSHIHSYQKSSVQSHYKSFEDVSLKSKISDRGTYEAKYNDKTSILSSISRNQSALRPYTFIPASSYIDLAIDHTRPRQSSPVTTHTSTLQLKVSPSGISELPRAIKYSTRDPMDKPKVVVSRPKDDIRYLRALSPMERSKGSTNLLSPYRKAFDHDDPIDGDLSQPTHIISSASTATAADHTSNNSSISTTTSTNIATKKRTNIMDTIKMLKRRVRDVITTEDRFSESHRLPSSSSSSHTNDEQQ